MLPRSSTLASRGGRQRPWPAGGEPAGRRPAVAFAGVALLLVAGATVALLGDDGSPGSSGAPPAKTVPADIQWTTDAALADAAPGPVEAVVEPLLVAPEDVTWQLFMGVALPYSPTFGPTVVYGPVYGGFERSQSGALLAAVHLGVRYLLTPGEGWREVLDRQVLPGAGRDAFARNRTGIDPQAPPGTYGQIAGFRIVTFTPQVAVVQLVSRFSSSGVLQVSTTTVRWIDDDWRLQLQPDGGTSPTAQAVPSLDGFVVWGA
ncbi:MAG: hypothetical protein F2825_00275 [Actinobacteria bacterium]|uniref:Unannotated protein n=1 Tax=freshwater metagenome TaxID=449393 RepID=A0A6J7FMC5_9ZZZZ|nr:hypothetical protein [Actinomycetota bacterium]